jgi:hypothetical protein
MVCFTLWPLYKGEKHFSSDANPEDVTVNFSETSAALYQSTTLTAQKILMYINAAVKN